MAAVAGADGRRIRLDQVAQVIDTLWGGEGSDLLDGGAGNDTYYLTGVTNVVLEEADGGIDTIRTTQTSIFLADQVENLVLERKLKHDANPVMTWMVSNLVVKVSKFNELRSPTKERPENKIDGPMAMLMALGRAMAVVESTDIQQGFVIL